MIVEAQLGDIDSVIVPLPHLLEMVNGADGISEIEGKAARVATSKLGKSEFQYLAEIGKRGGLAFLIVTVDAPR
jgi:hypothetical protein